MPRPLFPLPLASIETLHLFDDPPAYPNNLFACLTFAAPLDESIAREAFRLALVRHVRGSAIVEMRRGRCYWVDHPELSPEFVWRPASLSGQFRPLDLYQAPGVRVVVHEMKVGWRVQWQVHHALVDGLGGLQFVRDWMVYYDNVRSGRPREQGLTPLDAAALHRRNHLGLMSRRYLVHLWRQPIALFGAAKFLFRDFQTLSAPAGGIEQTVGPFYPTTATYPISREEVMQLRRAAHREQVTLNSLLLAATFGATDELLRRQPNYSERDCVRAIVPISIRTTADGNLPACNRASLVQLDRRPAELKDPRGLARGIHFELGLIRRWQFDKMFLIAVRINALSTRWLRYSTARQSRRATTMLTNLGRPFLKSGLPREHRRIVMGGVRLEDVAVVAPIRAGMPISLAAIEYGGQLNITLHYDPRVITAEAGESLLHRFGERLRQFVSG